MRLIKAMRGQALAEFALIFPVFMLLLMGIIAYGLFAFYTQQLENAAREAARYAATHSSTAQCPTVSRLNPQVDIPQGWFRCDAPEDGWPRMTEAARSKVWGMSPNLVSLTACWSGHVDPMNNYDADPRVTANVFTDCTIAGINPKTDPSALACPAPATVDSAMTPEKADGDDKASSIAAAIGNNLVYPTTVTVYACMNWRPPMSGLLFIPNTITLRAVATEALQRQQ